MTVLELIELAAQLGADSARRGVGGPFGAVIARDGEVVATGQNRVLLTGDPTAHAEVVAIRAATAVLRPLELDDAGRVQMLSGCILATSSFPCLMCLGATQWARLDRIYYACSVTDARAIGFDDADQYESLSVPERERPVPLEQIGREAGLAAFRVWSELPQRTRY